VSGGAKLDAATALRAAALKSELQRLAEETEDPDLVRAARAAARRPSGRPAINDAAAVAEVRKLVATGQARSFRAVCWKVARTKPGNRRSTAERLRRKVVAEDNAKKCAT